MRQQPPGRRPAAVGILAMALGTLSVAAPAVPASAATRHPNQLPDPASFLQDAVPDGISWTGLTIGPLLDTASDDDRSGQTVIWTGYVGDDRVSAIGRTHRS